MEERIQKIISASGIMSRRAAEELIAAGRVTVNGAAAAIGMKADPGSDEILVDGKPLPRKTGYVYVMLNKPRGYITASSDDRGRKTVMDLISELNVRVYPVGRLDMDSEGLLLLTNDGEFANLLAHPSGEKEKTYRVSVRGRVSDLSLLERPIEIDGRMTRPAKAAVLKRTDSGAVLSITIKEGRNRQVRRLCEAAGLEVKRLKRVSLGSLQLGELRSGEWRNLTDREVKALKASGTSETARTV